MMLKISKQLTSNNKIIRTLKDKMYTDKSIFQKREHFF